MYMWKLEIHFHSWKQLRHLLYENSETTAVLDFGFLGPWSSPFEVHYSPCYSLCI